VRSVLSAAGLPVVALDSSVRLGGSEPERTAADLRACIDLAATWEAPMVRVFGGGSPGQAPDTAVLERMASVLDAAAADAERAGVAVVLETHDVLSSAAAVAELLARVETPAVGALWDLLHTHRVGEAPELVTDLLGDRLLHVHVKDGKRRPDGAAWDLVLLGRGEVPVEGCLRALKDRGYRGWVSVEWEKRWHPEIEEPEVALPQHAEVLSALVDEVWR
jgi:fatty-acyl-CoA synthase